MHIQGPVLTVTHDGGDSTEISTNAMLLYKEDSGDLIFKTLPMSLIDDLLEAPARDGRTLVAAIGGTSDGQLVVASPDASGGACKMNRGPVTTTPRVLGALDTIEIDGTFLRVSEPGQRLLVCQNCHMSNTYDPSINCSHCGTRLINAATRLL